MIYLAGSCSSEHRTFMRKIAGKLRELGETVYCPFELKIENAWDYSQEDWAKMVFDSDIKALDEAETVIVISPGRISSAGTNWEQGYSYAKGKRVYVFQITEESTSLMTFCGCTSFRNTTESELAENIRDYIKLGTDECGSSLAAVPGKCRTTLT